MACAEGGIFHLRIDDIDQSRARAQWEDQIYDDLAWLGLDWPRPVRRQSDHLPEYRAALDRLTAKGLTFPCRCTRRAIEEAAANAPQEGGTEFGPDGRIYPGTCRNRSMDTATPEDVIRLDMARAVDLPGPAAFTETGPEHAGTHSLDPQDLIQTVGDVVLARRGMGASYHLSVVVDDAAQAITHVVRGADLFTATRIHVLLQRLLDLPTPVYHHHRLIRDESGKRLAKRDDARAIATYRAEGKTPQDIRRMVGLPAS